MNEPFVAMLSVGGKTNSLGKANEVIELVLNDKARLDELYKTMFYEDAWVRMRAADAFEKICRRHPDWIQQYIDKIQNDLAKSQQASIQWHIAQIYTQVELTDSQKQQAIDWLAKLVSTTDVDWIVASNSMDALAYFVRKDEFEKTKLVKLLDIQLSHKSKAVAKRAEKLLTELS